MTRVYYMSGNRKTYSWPEAMKAKREQGIDFTTHYEDFNPEADAISAEERAAHIAKIQAAIAKRREKAANASA